MNIPRLYCDSNDLLCSNVYVKNHSCGRNSVRKRGGFDMVTNSLKIVFSQTMHSDIYVDSVTVNEPIYSLYFYNLSFKTCITLLIKHM